MDQVQGTGVKKTFLEVVSSAISLINRDTSPSKNNVIIGGSYALALHGLMVDAKPMDIDLVVYSPTPRQMANLNSLSYTFGKPSQISSQCSTRRSYKFDIHGREVDFLIEYDSKINTNEMLQIPLRVSNIGIPESFVSVQSIKGVMEARSRYKRTKDYESCLNLKNMNFNI